MKRVMVAATLVFGLFACGDDGGDAGEPDGVDGTVDVAGDAPESDVTAGDTVDDTADAEVDAGPVLTLHATFDGPPADPLEGTGLESCAVYQEEACVEGTLRRCAVYDTGAEAFTDEPDALVRRAFLYDRWFDLYTSPDGQTVKREFTEPMGGDTPESEWAAPEVFARYNGGGDSAIWTGVATNAATFRYMVTGTDADYARMEASVRAQLLLFDVTGIPGHLARHHYLLAAPGAPKSDAHYLRHVAPEDLDHNHHPIGDVDAPDLPEAYQAGVLSVDGEEVDVTPTWYGVPSIDQYTGPLISFPLVWPLLRDDSLRDRIAEHVTCYLKRLQRLEIRNLQDAPEAKEALQAFFAEGTLALDPDDIDLMGQDTLVGYYLPGPNAKNADTFDRSCPDTVAMEATRVVDATADDFLLQMFALGQDLDAKNQERPGQMDHFYLVNVRGADAVHMLHLAAISWWMTGHEQYLDFLVDVLLGDLRADEVSLTAQAFRNPPWCYKYYADHISYTPHWQFLTMLGDGALRDTLVRAMEEEHWQKAMERLNNAKFDVMYASMMPEDVATGLPHAAEEAAEMLRTFGGNDGLDAPDLDAPRRNYDVDRGAVIDRLPPSITLVCPTEEERLACEEPGDVLGIPMDGKVITYECDGRPGECVLDNGTCAEAVASEGLPSNLRLYHGFTWQYSGLLLGADNANQGQQQNHGLDLTEPYWMARYYDLVPEGDGLVLAWEDAGACSAE